jgi:DNA-binding response OmpR family regulator
MSHPLEPQSTPAAEAVPVTGDKAQGRVLLVEDDRAVRRYLQVILERARYEVICAADGLEAMKIALAQSIDAVVTDAIMPHLSGQELCRFLRSYPTLSTLPIILLSAFESKTAPTEAGGYADVCLMKPVKAEELTAHLSRLIGAAKKTRG